MLKKSHLRSLFQSFSAITRKIGQAEGDVPDGLLLEQGALYSEALKANVESIGCFQAKLNIIHDYHAGGLIPADDIKRLGDDLDELIEARKNPANVTVPIPANCASCPLSLNAALDAA